MPLVSSPPPSLFILDDDVGFVHAAAELARARGFVITVAGTLEQARARLAAQRFDLALLDLGLPDGNGLDLLAELDLERTQVILVTGRPTLDSALQALRTPVVDYVVKPLHTSQFTALLDQGLRRRPLLPLPAGQAWHGLAGRSPAMADLARQARRVAPTPAAVFISGENGVGKARLAGAIHAESGRRGPFVALDCSALPADQLADGLFGHERGVGGAHARQPGLFEQAQGGTLFLAEVTALPPALQQQLLQALATRRVRRLGGSDDIAVDVRVISASRHAGAAAIGADRLREDLYWRLAEFTIAVPPLRERQEDIVEIALLFLDRLNQRHDVQRTLTQEGAERLLQHAWPGNVRELKQAIQRAFLLAEDDNVTPAPGAPAAGAPLAETDGTITFAVGTPMHEVERRMLFKTLAYFGNNKARTAQALGITTKTIYNRLHAYRAAGTGDSAGNDAGNGHDDA